MTVANGIKKLNQHGRTKHEGTKYSVVINEYEVSFRANGEDRPDQQITCAHTRPLTDHDDIQSDYFAGSYWPNLTQAIRYATKP